MRYIKHRFVHVQAVVDTNTNCDERIVGTKVLDFLRQSNYLPINVLLI